jgi:hypothetical protein
MSTPSFEEKQATKSLVDKCRIYLDENFHKFTEENRIKIALSLISKLIPTQSSIEYSGTLNENRIVIVYHPDYKRKEEIGTKTPVISNEVPRLTE